MISASEQNRDAVAALHSNDPRDWACGGREIVRITRLHGVEAQRLIDMLCALFDGDTILIDARPTSTPDDAAPRATTRESTDDATHRHSTWPAAIDAETTRAIDPA